jgi:hypothetical protein
VFIALDQLVALVLETAPVVSAFDIVMQLREDRFKMVQSLAQFMFLDSLLADLLESAIDNNGRLDGCVGPRLSLELRSASCAHVVCAGSGY